MAAPTLTRPVSAALTFAGTTAYYASPDVVRSRRARAWLKGGLMTGLALVSLAEWRTAQQRAAQERRPVADEPTEETTEEEAGSLSTRQQVALGGVGAAALAGSVVAVVAAERWVFARGERRRAAGKRLAHTAPALAMGALSAALTLVPMPEERSAV
jgi:hypothetical protein